MIKKFVAFGIHDSVVRGERDNRLKGKLLEIREGILRLMDDSRGRK